MTLSDIAKQAQKFTEDNSPAILTGLGVVGTLTSSFVVGRVSYKLGYHIAHRDLARDELDRQPLTVKEIAKEYWTEYIPSAVTIAGTVASIIGANRISSRRTAAMAAAYALSDRAFTEYKDKVTEKLGANKEKSVRTELAEEHVTKTPPSSTLVSSDGSQVMVLDSMSGRYFLSSMEHIRQAQNTINDQCLRYKFATLEDFYDLLQLEPTALARELGWTAEDLLKIEFSAVLTTDKRPCMVIDYRVVPIRGDFR